MRREIFLFILSAALALLILLGVFTQTPLFRSWMRGLIEGRLRAEMGGEVSVGRISGNLVTGLVGERIIWIPDALPVRRLYVGSISASYRPWRLLRGRFDVVSLVIQRPQVEIALDQLLEASEEPEERPEEGEPSPPPGQSLLTRIAVGEFVIEDGRLVLEREGEEIEVSNLDVKASLRPTADGFGILVEEASLAMPRRLLGRATLSGLVTYNYPVRAWRVTDFRAQTPSSFLYGELTLGKSVFSVRTEADGASLSLSEIGRLLQRPGEEWKGRLGGEIALAWIDGELEGSGQVALTGFEVEGWGIDSLNASAVLIGDTLRLDRFDTSIGEGTVSGRAKVWRRGEEVVGDASLEVSRFDLSQLSPAHLRPMSGTLNGSISLAGSGRSRDDLDLNAELSLVRSTIGGLAVDAATATMTADERRVVLREFQANCLQGAISGKGWITTEKMHWEVAGEKIDGASVGRLAARDIVQGTADFTLVIDGPIGDPSVTGRIDLADGNISSLAFAHLSVDLALSGLRHPFAGTGTVGITDGSLAGQQFQQGMLEFEEWGENETVFRLNVVREDSAGLTAEGRVKVDGEELWGEVSEFSLSAGDFEMRSVGPFTVHRTPQATKLYRSVLTLKKGEFALAEGQLSLMAEMDSEGAIAVQTSATRLDLEALSQVLGLGWRMKGLADLDVRGRGDLASPEIEASFSIRNLAIGEVRGDVLRGQLSYKDRTLTLANATLERSGVFSVARGFVPIDLGLKDVEERWPDEPLSLEAVLNDAGVWVFYPLSDMVHVTQGRVDANVSVTGTVRRPTLDGEMTLHSGRLTVRYLGTLLEDVEGYAVFAGDTLKLKSIAGRTETGFARISGSVRLTGMVPEDLDLAISVYEAPITAIPEARAVVSGELTVTGKVSSPFVAGRVRVVRGEITRSFGEARDESMGKTAAFDYDLAVSVDRGLWFRNENAEIELQGELRARSEAKRFTLTGHLRSIRGVYYYFDRPLEIVSAELRFVDPARLDPELDIWAETVIRRVLPPSSMAAADPSANGRVDVTIRLHLFGTLTKPELELFSEPGYFSRQDILALLSLNLTTEELAELQQGEVFREHLPERVLAYFSERVLSRELRKRGLDMARLETEIFGTTEERSARLTVGKYISDDLFVSYTHDLFAASGDAFRVEYYLWGQSSLVGERDEEQRYGVGVEVKFRY